MTLPELFRHYLKSQSASSITCKNYVVDVNNFLDWLAQKTGIKYQIAHQAILHLFTKETLEEYKNDLLQENIPPSTLNRRLSALRKFGVFTQSQGWIKDNPALKVKNVKTNHTGCVPQAQHHTRCEKILRNFRKHLEQEKASSMTVKNYLSDLRHFLAWLEAS